MLRIKGIVKAFNEVRKQIMQGIPGEEVDKFRSYIEAYAIPSIQLRESVRNPVRLRTDFPINPAMPIIFSRMLY